MAHTPRGGFEGFLEVETEDDDTGATELMSGSARARLLAEHAATPLAIPDRDEPEVLLEDGSLGGEVVPAEVPDEGPSMRLLAVAVVIVAAIAAAVAIAPLLLL